jgi:hypothetical protein
MPATKFANKHNAAARWNALPPGVYLTLEEAAEIIGISKRSLQNHYAHRNSLPLPVSAVFLRTRAGRAWGLYRLPDLPAQTTPLAKRSGSPAPKVSERKR